MLKSANKVIAIFLIALAIMYIIAAIRLPNYPYIPVDSEAVPITLGIILIILSIFLFFQKDNHDKKKLPKKDVTAILTVVGLILAYIMLLEFLGFFLSTALFLFVNTWIMGYRKWLSNLITSIAIPLFIYLLFTQFLDIVLPRGILPF